MGYLTFVKRRSTRMPGAHTGAQKQCGLYLEQAKAANKKTFAGLGKGLAYNVTVVGAPEILLVLTTPPLRRPMVRKDAAQATPLWRGAPDFPEALAIFARSRDGVNVGHCESQCFER
jgi:hypothetical protein